MRSRVIAESVCEVGQTEAQVRRAMVLRMREVGFTFAGIAERLGIGVVRARQIFMTARRDVDRIEPVAEFEREALADDVRKLAKARYRTPCLTKAVSVLARGQLNPNRDWLVV